MLGTAPTLPSDMASRVARAAAWFPALRRATPPSGRAECHAVSGCAGGCDDTACAAAAALDPLWTDHPVPPGQSAQSLLRDAVARAIVTYAEARARPRRGGDAAGPAVAVGAAVDVSAAASETARRDAVDADATRGGHPGDADADELVQRLALRQQLPQGPAVDCYAVRALPDGRPMFATLVNTVYKSLFQDATVYTPWQGRNERVHAMAPARMRQCLLGVADVSVKPAHTRQFCVAYRAPHRANHHICAERLNVQETAVMSDAMGEFTLHVTLALQAIACRQPQLRVTERRRENCVYVSYTPFRIDIARLITHVAGCDIQPTRFSGIVVRHPELERRCLNIFPKGVVICVGAKTPQQMMDVFDRFMDAIYAARVVPAPLPPPPAAAASRKRSRDAAMLGPGGDPGPGPQ